MTNKQIRLMKARLFNKNVERLSEAKEIKKRAIRDVEYMTNKCIRLMRELDDLELANLD